MSTQPSPRAFGWSRPGNGRPCRGGDEPLIDPGQLLRRCADGCEDAWRQLVEHYGALVYSVPSRLGLGEADCDDVFQTVFASLLRQLEDVRDGRSLPRWLVTTAQRTSWKLLEQQRRHGNGNGGAPVEEPAADTIVELWERHELVRAALRQLGGPCERLLRALFFEMPHASYDQLAERLRMPRGSIGPSRSRCLARLLEIIRSMETGGDEGTSGDAPR